MDQTLDNLADYGYVTPDIFDWNPEEHKWSTDGKSLDSPKIILNTGSFDLWNFNMYIDKQYWDYPSGFDYKQIVSVVWFAGEMEWMVFMYRNLWNKEFLKLPTNEKQLQILHKYFGKTVI
jgi:hypothetical protein